MLKFVSIISAIAWAALAALMAFTAPGNADKALLYCIAGVAVTGMASAVAVLIAPRKFVLTYSVVLSIVGAVIFAPYTFLGFALCIGNFPATSMSDWLLAVDLLVLVCLAALWPFQLRRYRQQLADERLTTHHG
jgi:hypothetical protein